MRPTLIVAVFACGLVAGCARDAEPPAPSPATAEAHVQLANPAAVNCAKAGGRSVIEQRPSGGEFGVCLFEDNRQCEEWALLRGECPVGGRRITGYATQAGRWCAITGGNYTGVVESDNSERGECELPGGKKCEAEAYWQGTCSR